MTASTLLGKAELLAWAAGVTGITPCEKYGDLKDGLIFLALARDLFPQDIDSTIVRLQRRGARDPTKNWSLLTSCLRRRRIPLHLCNRQAVEHGHTRHCYNMLVLFYFLQRLARGDQFSVDFAQPVDPRLAAFLQSPDSVAAVNRITEADAEIAAASAPGIDNGDEVQRGSDAERVVTRLSSPPSAAAVANSPSTHPHLHVPARVAAIDHVGRAVRFGSQEPNRADGNASLFSLPWRPRESPSDSTPANGLPHSFDDGGVPKRTVAARNDVMDHRGASSHRSAPPMSPFIAPDCGSVDGGAVNEGGNGENTVVDPVALPSRSTLSATLQTENRLLREELQYVKAVGQLLITQQRGAEAAAEMRAAAMLQDELSKAQLSHLHDLRQLEVTLASASSSPAATPSFSRYQRSNAEAQWAALTHRTEVAERTAAQLYEKLRENYQTYDTTLQQLRRVFHSIDAIVESARPATPASSSPSSSSSLSSSFMSAPHTNAAAYEEAVADAMMAQLRSVPTVLRDAFRGQLRALLLTLNTLRVRNERLLLERDVRAAEDTSGQQRQKVQQLYDRVTEVLVATFSSPGTEDMKWASEQLVSLLDTFVQQQQQQQQQQQVQPSTVMEKALAEQCETIARLRKEVRQRGEALNAATSQLADAEHHCRELSQRCAVLENQLRTTAKKEEQQGESSDVSQTPFRHGQRTLLGHAAAVAEASVPLTDALSSSSLHCEAFHPNFINSTKKTSALEERRSNNAGDVGAPRAAPPRRITSPHQPGAFRSPSPSDSEDKAPLPAPQQSRTPASEADSLRHNRGAENALRHFDSDDEVSVHRPSLPKLSESSKTEPSTAAAAPPSLLLSAAELERRKREILRKFNVE